MFPHSHGCTSSMERIATSVISKKNRLKETPGLPKMVIFSVPFLSLSLSLCLSLQAERPISAAKVMCLPGLSLKEKKILKIACYRDIEERGNFPFSLRGMKMEDQTGIAQMKGE